MKKTIITLICLLHIFSLVAQEPELNKKWSLGISFTPNYSFLHNPSDYTDYFGEITYYGYNYRSASAIKDHPIFEYMNFGLRFSYSLNKDSEIETGLILSNKDYYSPQGMINDEMPVIYFNPGLYFIDIPITYKYKILDIGTHNLKLTGGLIAGIPLYEHVNGNHELELYNIASTGADDFVITKNFDFYPLCMSVNIGLRFSTNDNKRFNFDFGPVFQSAIMPFSRKPEGNTIDLTGSGHTITVLNPDKGFAPYFIGFDLIFKMNFSKKS